MRDDIHRFAPVPPCWKRLIKACYHADWVEEGRAAATKAAIEELRRGLDRPFLADLSRQSHSPQLFIGDVVDALCRRQSGPFTSRLATHMKGEAQSGAAAGGIIARSIEAATKGGLEAQLRNIDGFLANDPWYRRDRRECMRRLRASCAGVDFSTLSANAATGVVPKYQAPVRGLDIDAGIGMQP